MIRANQPVPEAIHRESQLSNLTVHGMGGRNKHRKHPDPANAPAGHTGGGKPDPPTRQFALQMDVLAVAFGTALRAHDLRCDATDSHWVASTGGSLS